MSLFRRRRHDSLRVDEWQPWQIERIIEENEALSSAFPDFEFVEPLSQDARVTGRWTSNGRRTYGIEIALGAGYPDAAPSAYIVEPFPLYGHGRRAIHTYGTSHAMHTFASDRKNMTKLCAVHPDEWNPGWTIPKIIQKAQLWLLAYEYHCDSGSDIDDYLLD